LSALESYKTIRAPFAGTITARNTDIGQLIKADTDSDPELFNIADTHQLRLYVPVPQNYAAVIHPGLEAELSVPEHPGEHFKAHLIGDSTAIDRRSGTLLAQFVADNPNGELLPGDYAEATLPIPVDTHGVSIPASALIFRAQGTQVAVLDAQNHIHLQAIHIGLDLGERLVIDQGLKPADRVVDNPPDALREGDPVQLADAPTVPLRPRLKPLAAVMLLALQGCSLAPTTTCRRSTCQPTIANRPAMAPGTARSRPTNWRRSGGRSTANRAWISCNSNCSRPTRTWRQRWRTSMRPRRMPANCMPGCSRKSPASVHNRCVSANPTCVRCAAPRSRRFTTATRRGFR